MDARSLAGGTPMAYPRRPGGRPTRSSASSAGSRSTPIPPPPLLSAEDEAGIRRYVHHLSRGHERVQQVTAIAVPDRVGSFCVWDVQTDQGRWWVVGPPLNLYAQELVPGLDYVLSLHRSLFEGPAAAEAN